jgi:inosine-uridine nucleoside N-ribohydrolase
MIKILLDTDIGTDVDDAVCLAYLLAQPDCELLGITTVTGEAEKRASLASVLCKAAGVEIPIFPGAETPLKVPQRQMKAQQAEALLRWPHETRFPRGQAVAFMKRTIHNHPGEVILLTVGPLTNAAQLFLTDPESAAMLKGLVMMGGVFRSQPYGAGQTEWNTAGDPHATEIVYRTRIQIHRSLGLNVTQQVVLDDAEVRQRFTAPLLRPVLDFAEIWFDQFYPSITFHDPLAAATIFDETLCVFVPGTVTVDMDEQPGRTFWQPGGNLAPHEVAVSVDPERYFQHFFSRFSSPIPGRSLPPPGQ